jgi:protein required for attachment to host cells
MSSTWVVTADSSRARFFTVENRRGPLREIEVLVHPEGRLHEQDLTTDFPGRAFDSGGEGRHAMGQSVSPKEHEIIAFAKQIADYLEKARVEGKCDKLFLMAPPRVLGLLRQNLSETTAALVAQEIGKNLVQQSTEDIRGYLPERF